MSSMSLATAPRRSRFTCVWLELLSETMRSDEVRFKKTSTKPAKRTMKASTINKAAPRVPRTRIRCGRIHEISEDGFIQVQAGSKTAGKCALRKRLREESGPARQIPDSGQFHS